ncbi:MBOAT family O-acyltransferase [Sulfurospirillum sp.]|uniref:MBOAT family O-acyltransferase n=1 Tax=Sulfurospirillum sp. TaxID=2053622 RepID=UPI002FDC7B59
MVFSSLIFIYLFLPIALITFYIPKIFTKKNIILSIMILTLLSFIFYFFGSGKMMILLLISIVLNFYFGELLVVLINVKKRKIILFIGITVNILLLLYFKYIRFILDLIGYVSDTQLFIELHPYLPIGISFYTFMAIAYLVDIYKDHTIRANLLEFSTFLSLFPHLVAGPIVRFQEISQELQKENSLTIDNFYKGVVKFTMGLGMKVLIADNLAPTVDKIFALDTHSLTMLTAWFGAVTYSFQIYFDFAGYSAMAIGLALMFGFHFPENFSRPYLSNNVTEFWKRWHMSLSRWLKDYLYIPLGGNQKGEFRTYINLMIVFLVCGLWHGAALTFVVWGFYYGVILTLERLLKNKYHFEMQGFIGVLLTFFLVTIGWVLFRSESIAQAILYLKAMFTISRSSDIQMYQDPLFMITLLSGFLFSYLPFSIVTNLKKFNSIYIFLKTLSVFTILIFSTIYMTGNDFKPFIYFRF